MANSEAPAPITNETSANDNFIAFSSSGHGTHQQPHKYRPYNNSWRNKRNNQVGDFNPTGFSSPIRHQNQHSFRGGRPQFRYNNSDRFSNRGFSGHRSFHNRSGNPQNFRKSNYQTQNAPLVSNLFHDALHGRFFLIIIF